MNHSHPHKTIKSHLAAVTTRIAGVTRKQWVERRGDLIIRHDHASTSTIIRIMTNDQEVLPCQ